jgi:hypothetical protein
MELQTFVDSLRTFYRERPFLQFDIELASGEVIRVVHPDAMAFIGRRAVVLTTDGLAHHLDHTGVVRISSTGEAPATVGAGLKDNGPLTSDN